LREILPAWLAIIGAIELICFFATLGKPYWAGIFILICFYALAGVAWNWAAGITGLLSLGHSIFIGIGAYAVAVGQIRYGLEPWITLLIGIALSSLVSVFIGYVCFRFGLRGYFLAICTLAFGQVVFFLASASELLGRSDGLTIPMAAAPLRYWQFNERWPYSLIIMLLLFVVLLLGNALMRSRAGHYWRAIHDDEDAAETIGVPVFRYKLFVFFISAVVTSIAGSFYAIYFTFVDPRSVLSVEMSVELLIFSIVGGLRLQWGPVLGAALLIPVTHVLNGWIGSSVQGATIAIYAIILILISLRAPDGLGPALERAIRNAVVRIKGGLARQAADSSA